MLPGVSSRVLVLKDPIPPTIVPYVGPPAASAPWQLTHSASYTALPSATVPRPGGRPAPSRVRMSMFQAATSASPIGSPKPAEGRSGGRDAGGGAHAPTITTEPTRRATLRDGIAHLPVGTHRPGEDTVVMLDEPRNVADLHDLGDRGLHVASRVHGPALDDGRLAIPGPAVTKTREALVEDRLFERRRLPVPAAID